MALVEMDLYGIGGHRFVSNLWTWICMALVDMDLYDMGPESYVKKNEWSLKLEESRFSIVTNHSPPPPTTPMIVVTFLMLVWQLTNSGWWPQNSEKKVP